MGQLQQKFVPDLDISFAGCSGGQPSASGAGEGRAASAEASKLSLPTKIFIAALDWVQVRIPGVVRAISRSHAADPAAETSVRPRGKRFRMWNLNCRERIPLLSPEVACFLAGFLISSFPFASL